jgi:hypothetical protein
MSIIAYYLHVNDTQLHAIQERPAVVWNVNSDPRFAKAALIDVDKDYEVVAWLLSEKKRKEQAHQVATFKAISHESDVKANWSKAEFSKVVAAELQKLGLEVEDTNALDTDAVLEAIEGRGTEAQRDPKINFGLGSARVFQPNEVKKLAAALEQVSDANLRKSFNRSMMAKFEVGGMDWLDEKDSALDDFLIPAFKRIQMFYMEAAKRSHYVLVIYQ